MGGIPIISKLIVLLIIVYLAQRPDAGKLLLFGVSSLLLFLSPSASTVGDPVHDSLGRIGKIAVIDTVVVIVIALIMGLRIIDVLLLGVVMHAIVGVATPGNQILLGAKPNTI